MDLELTSKRAIVTGGRQGIGRAIAAALAAEGAHVVIASRDADGLAKRAQELRNSTGGTVEAHVVDTASADSVTALVEDTVAALGGIDILVNNATTIIGGRTSTLTRRPRRWRASTTSCPRTSRTRTAGWASTPTRCNRVLP